MDAAMVWSDALCALRAPYQRRCYPPPDDPGVTWPGMSTLRPLHWSEKSIRNDPHARGAAGWASRMGRRGRTRVATQGGDVQAAIDHGGGDVA